ncbi:hypothetical protein [Dongia sp.]|uniref:hypothetical protein n=1 Tax=Dongia sp. TaxID=1977262 RepID=UPI0035B4B28C
MAIGDSMFNGVRSAMISDELAAHSPVVLFARAAGIGTFRRPIYPRPVLLDVEAEARKSLPELIKDFKTLKAIVVPNARLWLSDGDLTGRPAFHDNIACAGATYESMHLQTGAKALEIAKEAFAKIETSKSLDFGDLLNLWFGLNDAFVLDPSRGGLGKQISDMSQVAQVIARRPKRLLVNVGSNEGLFNFGLMGKHKKSDLDPKTSVVFKVLVDGARELGVALRSGMGDRECDIHFNTLVRPRCVPNLAPRRDDEMLRGPTPPGAYFERYSTKVVLKSPLKTEVVNAYDRMISAANDAAFDALVGAIAGSKLRAHKVDMYAEIDRYDAKHWGDSRALDVGAPWRMRNLPFATGGPTNKRQGGICGLDNMHPTGVGYAKMAQAMLTSAGLDPARIDIRAAFLADSLLQSPPAGWETTNVIVSVIAEFLLLSLMRRKTA